MTNRPTVASSERGYEAIWSPMLSMTQAEIDASHQVVNDMNVYAALLAFLLGVGGEQHFYQVDEMTLALRKSSHMSTVRRDLANLIRQGGYDPEDDYSYRLPYGDDQASLSRVVADVIVAVTGLSGDAEDRARATIAAVGSFDLTYRVMAVDNDTRRAVVAFEATNIWGLESLSRQPVGSGAGDSLLSGRTSGSMQNVRQFWYWVEEIRF